MCRFLRSIDRGENVAGSQYGREMSEFDQARRRVERAAQHAVELAGVWNDYLAPHPFEFELVRDGSLSQILRISQTSAVPSELSIIFGEWLFNMRACLHYIIWATAVHTSGILPPLGEDGLQYPIYDTESSWNRNKWRLKPLGDHHQEMLHTMQPFNSNADANFLGWINRLARIDRHRRLTIWTARLGELGPVVRAASGQSPRLEWGQSVFDHQKCDAARFTFSCVEDADAAEVNPRCAIDPEIAEWSHSPFWGRIRFSDRLRLMQVCVSSEIDLYEYDCTGNVALSTAVTDTFRAESDARRRGGFFPLRQMTSASPVNWVEAAAGPRSSNEESFRGVDFPTHGPGW